MRELAFWPVNMYRLYVFNDITVSGTNVNKYEMENVLFREDNTLFSKHWRGRKRFYYEIY